MTILAPASLDELALMIREALAAETKLEIRGGGSKAGVGAPRDAAILDMRGLSGIVDYDRAELVLTLGAGTPLAQVQALLAENGQMLAFEPFDQGPVFGAPPGAATIGGVVAGAISGPRRLSAGAARDHLLGFTAVSGRGEIVSGGGKVVKNVTGFDLPKLMAGSWGRLGALAEISLKVLPAPAATRTCVLRGQDAPMAAAAMARALGSAIAPAAAAYLPGAAAQTLLRIEGFGPSLDARWSMLEAMFGPVEAAPGAVWDGLRTLAPLPRDGTLWRLSIPARHMPAIGNALETAGAPWLADWGGALVWTVLADPALARRIAGEAGGHAMLFRADPAVRSAVPAFHPQPAVNAALEARVIGAFDPLGVFATGRFRGDMDAD
ncbi:glycolate oxidase subunit GlcE [Sphingobium sp. SYK-6]|uniref:FAD-binding protein n=1 Tax=Sphingobium sp. (strain NBRC 103272 / SYK-6) TaxID=627192 RepID=UPI0002277A90|nr:FAD-binding protein [Sphingobium sp. SYK-6]BAK68155.1 glycolate oxidase subunit GlcE [Sphingobium sp. SYK-6]